jgi:hypothetical protein
VELLESTGAVECCALRLADVLWKNMNHAEWPALVSERWSDTYGTLHMWTQIVGKVCLARTPRLNHFWNLTFQVTSRGLMTPLMPAGDRVFTMTFDFISHQLLIQTSDGATEAIPLQPRTVADFYQLVTAALKRLNIETHIWSMPVEVPNPVRFENDLAHHAYDAESANTLWRILTAIKPVFETFRSKFIGKCSPVHFFWGSFDLAVTRFSGRRAPERPGADAMTREAYSHEVISHGFWPGSGSVKEPSFYAYAAPEPEGFKTAVARPSSAFYSTEFSEFFLPYEAVRTATNPEAELSAFLETTYGAGADLGHWNRAELERS